jgi:hypothetical protein
MRIVKIIFVCLVCFVVATLGWSQNPSAQVEQSKPEQSKPAHGVPGYLNPQTGTFTTQAQSTVPTAAVATTTVIFRLIYNFRIQFNDNTTGNTTTCGVNISTNDAAGSFYEGNTVISPDGGQTCQVSILAQWNLATPTTDMISAYAYVESFGSTKGNYDQLLPDRYSDIESIPQIPVPQSGETLAQPTIDVVM